MTATPFSVRAATAADLDAIVEFNARLAHESEGKALDRAALTRGVEFALADRSSLAYWVVEVADDPADPESRWVVGQAGITREWSDWRAGWIWWFQSVYVHPDYRGRGVFRLLHARIRELARASEGVIGLRLYVESSNERAQQVYRSLGMTPGGYDVYEDLWGIPAAPRPPGHRP